MDSSAIPSIEPQPSLRGAIFKGTLWMVGARWAIRAIGLVSTIILVRLLSPQDFGLIAMSTVVLGLMEVLFAFGIDTALIQNPTSTRAHWDTAWTIKILQGLVMAFVLAAAAPLAARYYHEPRVLPLMLFLACGTVLSCFENIGTVAFRKELQFAREFFFLILKKLFQFVITISLAFAWKDYWALAVGIVAGSALSTISSYVIQSYRPRLSLKAAADIWGFSYKMVLINIATYINNSGEQLIIGGFAGTRQLGLYSVANEMAHLPTTEMISPTARATVPGLAKLRHDPERLKAAFLNLVSFVAAFALPAGVGIALVASDLIAVIFGDQWTDATVLIQILAVSGALRATYSPAGNLLVVWGRLRVLVQLSWLLMGLLIALLIPAVQIFGVVGAALVQVTLAVVSLALYLHQVSRHDFIRLSEWISILWRPTLSCGIMGILVWLFALLFENKLYSLLASSAFGALAYSVVLLGLWHWCGRPSGPEHHIVALLGQIGSRVRVGFLRPRSPNVGR